MAKAQLGGMVIHPGRGKAKHAQDEKSYGKGCAT